MSILVGFIIACVVLGIYTAISESNTKAANREFENSMKDIDVSEKYKTINNQVGLIYDKEKQKARILFYSAKKYEDIDSINIGGVCAFFTTLFFTNKNNNNLMCAYLPLNVNAKKEEMKLHISTIEENFSADKFVYNRAETHNWGIAKTGKEPCVIIDNTNKKVMFLSDVDETYNKKIISFKDIISVEIVENGTTIFSKSTTRTIGGALVGNALMGGAGAVVGGLSGNSKQKGKVKNISVKILVRDVNNPTITIVILKEREMDTTSNDYQSLRKFADEIKDVISVIIDVEDKSEKSIARKIVNTDTTEELMKLAGLKEKGLLTDEEFAKMKARLLV